MSDETPAYYMETIAITGSSGVIGSFLISRLQTPDVRIIDLYHTLPNQHERYRIKHLPLDLLDRSAIERTLDEAKPDKIIHLAGIAHIDACERDKPRGKNGFVWKINVDATREIARFCQKNRIPIVFLSTECVFDGKQEYYDETSETHPINWYGATKQEAEECLLSTDVPATVIRSVIVYHENDRGKTLFGTFYRGLKANAEVQAVTDQYITPTHIGDVTDAIQYFIEHPTKGIYHIAPCPAVTPYDFAVLIAKHYGLNNRNIGKTTLSDLYGADRAALRLRHASLCTTVPFLHTWHIRHPNEIFSRR